MNNIGDEGATLLLDAMRQNFTLNANNHRGLIEYFVGHRQGNPTIRKELEMEMRLNQGLSVV